jgi:hypothetical protein
MNCLLPGILPYRATPGDRTKLHGMEGVRGSNPLSSTKPKRSSRLSGTIFTFASDIPAYGLARLRLPQVSLRFVVLWWLCVRAWWFAGALPLSGALTWDHVDLEAATVSVWRSVRAHGDTKTVRPRRTLRLPQMAVEALRGQMRQQAPERAIAGELWQQHGLVFATTVGTAYESHNLRRDFRKVTAAAGLGSRWVPKELRTSFVSMMSYQGVPVAEIARLAGHASSRTTVVIYASCAR